MKNALSLLRRLPARGVIALLALLLITGSAYGALRSDGSPPPELAADATAWPAYNYDLSNSRYTISSGISSSNVATLKQKWTFTLPRAAGNFGAFTSNPVSANGMVYVEDPNSNVYALNQQTGALVWKHEYHSPTPSGGPNGVTLGYGLLYGTTATQVFALNPQTGAQAWISQSLPRNKLEGIDMAPQVFGNKVVVSTIPGRGLNFYKGNSYGIVWALNAQNGQPIWKFSTVLGGDKLWGNAKKNGGGGLWYPPSVDSSGRVFLGVANPAPWPNSPDNPNATSRPGPNMFTDSLVALDGDTGKVLWSNQVVKHDVRDYDFMISPVITSQVIGGAPAEIVIGAGKMGKVVAFRADNGHIVWSIKVGKHKNDIGKLPKKLVSVCPGPLGGVETPMAEGGNTLYVPWLNLCANESAAGLGQLNFNGGTGGFTAVNPATGGTLWKRFFKTPDFGGATISNDVVFTSTYDGTTYALSVKDGSILWSAKAPLGINSLPAVGQNMLITGAGAVSKAGQHGVIIAYSLNGQ